VPILPEVKSWLAQPRKNLIDGKWVSSASGKTFEVLNPATEQVIAHVAYGGVEDVNRAVKAARRAFDDQTHPWQKMTPSERSRVVYKFGDLLEVSCHLTVSTNLEETRR
jgi:acyl-CoA reductase-like NAD-dependent aldehyde dehydrogenase